MYIYTYTFILMLPYMTLSKKEKSVAMWALCDIKGCFLKFPSMVKEIRLENKKGLVGGGLPNSVK